jgi:RHS repeat-associated protein
VWVSAHVPYTNYRGAVVDFSGKLWVPLAPALKGVARTPSTGVLRAMGYPVAGRLLDYQSAVQATDLVTQIRQEVEGYLQTGPGGTWEEQLGTRTNLVEHLKFLPSSLPAAVIAVTEEVPSLSASELHRVVFRARRGTGDASPVVLEATLPLSAVSGHRVTWSYTPASVEDHRTVNAFGGLYAVPMYLVRLRPQLKVGGQPVAIGTGNPLEMGSVHRLEVELVGPTGAYRTGQSVVAGSYHALALGAQETLRPEEPADDLADSERLAARLLSQFAHTYAEAWDAGENHLAGLLDVEVLRPLPSVVVASNAIRVKTVLGLPTSFEWLGVTLDASLRAAEPLAHGADTQAGRDWMRLSAAQGSALEGLTFAREFQVDGISADKGLAIARAAGGPGVVTLTSANVATELPGLALSAAVKTELDNWVRQGLTVEVPRAEIQRNAWRGAVWKVEEPATGAAGYFLAGGLAGGSSSEPPANWILDFLAQALGAPYSAEPNNDPLAVAVLQKTPAGDGQEGVAGEVFEQSIGVLARDLDGRPVVGAEVIFEVTQGGGKLIDAEGNEASPIFVRTDDLGIATVQIKGGEHTADNPVYTLRNAGDEFGTQSLSMVVDAVATAASRVVPIPEPFTAIAHPGPVSQLLDPDGGDRFGLAGQWVDTLSVVAADRFENPVSNVSVTFAAAGGSSTCSPPPSPFEGAKIFDFEECTTEVPVLGDCGSGSLTQTSTIRGAFAGVIMGNAVSATYPVSISAPGAPPLNRTYTEDRSCTASPLVTFNTSFLVDENHNNIQGTRAGERFERPIPVRLLYEAPDFEFKTDSEGNCFVEFKPSRSWVSTTGQISVEVDNGGSATGASQVGEHYEFFVFTGLTPGFNSLRMTAANVAWGTQTCNGVSDRTSTLSGNLPVVYSLLPRIDGVAPDPVVLDERGLTATTVKIAGTLDPPQYRALSLEVAIYEDGALLGRVVSPSRQGPSEVALPRGIAFDIQKTYEAELVASRGSRVEAKGDRFPLPLFQQIFANVSRSVVLSQEVDILNERLCQFGSNFTFTTTQEADVTLKFKKIESVSPGGEPNLGSEVILIDGETYPAGDHEFLITPTDLLPGDYVFELSGVSAVDGHEDLVEGVGSSEFRTREQLPVGHAVYKGVDLWDGHLSVVRQDVLVPGRGPDLELVRSYASNASKDPGPLGIGWTHSYDSRIVITPCGEVIVTGAAGGGGRFVDDGAGGLRPLKGYHGTLIANTGENSFDYFSKDGTKYHYIFARSNEFLLETIEDPNLNRTTLTYDRTSFEPKLVSVADASGRTLSFTYEHRSFTMSQGDVVTQVTGPAGISLTYTYDDNGNMTSAQREGGSRSESYEYPDTSVFDFETRNQLRAVVDEVSGARTEYTYERGPIGVQGDIKVPSIFLKSMTEPGGTTTFTYDMAALDSRGPVELLSTVQDRRGGTTSYTLNKYGSPLSITDPNGNGVSMTWAAADVFMESRTDARGNTTDFSHDADGNRLSESLSVSGPGGGGTARVEHTYASFARPIKDRVATTRNRNAVVMSFTYDGRGNLTGRSAPGFTESFTYAGNGDRLTAVDANGKTTRYTYDGNGNVATITDPLGGVTRATWDDRGRLLARTDANGNTEGYAYDTRDRIVSTSLPGGGTESTLYDDATPSQTFTDALDRETRTDFDKEGRPVATIDAMGHQKLVDYDSEGAKTGETNWFGNGTARTDTTFANDLGGRLVTRTEPLGRVTTYAYDGNGNVIRETLTGPSLDEPHVTEHEYDELDRRHTVRRTAGGQAIVQVTGFDLEGNVVVEIDPLGHSTTHTYDALNRRRTTVDAENGTSTFTYDAVGNQLTATDPLGHTRRREYDALNRVTRATDALGKATNYTYDPNGNLLSEIDPRLFVVRYQYDERNRLTRTERTVTLGATPPGLVSTTTGYDLAGNPTSIRYPNGRIETLIYDDLDRVTSRSDSLGPVSTSTYDANGNVTAETDAKGLATTRTFDALHRMLTETLPGGRGQSFTYDLAGNRLTRTDARGNTWSFRYDGLDRLVRVTDPPSAGTFTETTYDRASRVVAERDRRGNVTSFTRDNLGRVLTVDDPGPTSTTSTWDGVGNRLSETDRRGMVTTFTYDAENRPTTTVRAGVTVRRAQHDDVGNLRFETDANGNIVGYEYDERNLKVAENRPLASITRYGLDAAGDVVEERDPENRVSRWTYDLRRRTATRVDGAGQTTTYTYDPNGNQLTVTRPEGGTWTREYDDANRLIRVIDPLTNATEHVYDGNGNRTRTTDARAKSVTFEYDALDRQTLLTYADGAQEVRTYDGNGNLATLRDPKGQVATYTYDELNRETQIAYGPATPSTGDDLASRSKTYDGNGNPLTVSDVYASPSGTRTTTYTYDDFDRPLTLTDPRGETVSWAYDANGNRTRLTDPDGRVTTYGYDANNRLSTVTVPASGVTQYEYFRNHQLRRVAYPNGTEARHGYDLANRTTRLDNLRASAVISSYQYAYDRNNNRTEQIEVNGGVAETTTYAFDGADRLIQVDYPDQDVDYTYDPVGNRATEVTTDAGGSVVSSKAMTYDDRSRLVSVVDSVDAARSVDYAFDSNGNQIQRSQSGVDLDFAYDALDQLVEVQRGGTLLGRFLYDHEGMRVRRLLDGEILRYVYDDSSVLLQTDDAGNTIARYEYGPDRLLSLLHVTEGRQFYLFDGLRSIADLTKPDGTVQVRYQYDAWGNYRSTSGSSFNLFGFTGLEHDSATGLYYAKARFYDPETGRFLSEDPQPGRALNPPSLHRYLYAYSNPTVFVDPNGEIALIDNLIGGLVSVGVGYGVSLITGEEYTAADAAVDFGVGALTSGLSSIAKLQKLGKVARAVTKVTAETAIDVAGEKVRADLKGEEFDPVQAAVGSVVGQGVGKVAEVGAKKIADKIGDRVAKASDAADGGSPKPDVTPEAKPTVEPEARPRTAETEVPPTRAPESSRVDGDSPTPSSRSSAEKAAAPEPPAPSSSKSPTAVTTESPKFGVESGMTVGTRGAAPTVAPPFKTGASAGVPVTAREGVTTTVLGRFNDDTGRLLKELGDPVTDLKNFGANPGGFNLLNIPLPKDYDLGKFWGEVNRPWLDAAIARGDDIVMATRPLLANGKPDPSKLINPKTGGLTGFGQEYKHLLQNGYNYDPVTSRMVKRR